MSSQSEPALGWDRLLQAHTPGRGAHTIDLTHNSDEEDWRSTPDDAPVARSFDSNSRRSKSPIFPENALQLTLDEDDLDTSPSATPFSGSLPSTHAVILDTSPGSAPLSFPTRPPDSSDVLPPTQRSGHVRFHSRVRIASGLHSIRQPRDREDTNPNDAVYRPYTADRSRRASEGSIARSIAFTESEGFPSPASSVSVPIRNVDPEELPRGSYSQRLLQLAQRRGSVSPGTPVSRGRRRRFGERTPLIGARSGRTYTPRRRSIEEEERDEAALEALRNMSWWDLRWWWWKASDSASYCCGRDEESDDDYDS